MSTFNLVTDLVPKGDQPKAIDALCKRLQDGKDHNVLLGVTGSGKTFTMAHVIARLQRPTLIIAPNKTLAAQLYNEFNQLFPDNCVEYFVSYYDYYQPEAYIPSTDTYIQKDSSINEMIDKMRHSATRSVLSREDVIVVASVSCIFGLGAPEDYLKMRLNIDVNTELNREVLLRQLVNMHYSRNDFDFHRGVFRVRGDRVEIFPAYEEDVAIRIDLFGDQVESLSEIDPLKATTLKTLTHVTVFPASHYVTAKTTLQRTIDSVIQELKERTEFFNKTEHYIEAQRIEERTHFDLEMMQELGYCHGIENYSRHLTGRQPGQPPPTLLDYFPENYLVFLDESHIAVPQLRGMYLGDRSRKTTLVEFGFRLPSALDNRPLRFDEYEQRVNQVIYVSATPADYEIQHDNSAQVELIVRPTGLVDPAVEVRKATHQVDDLYEEILKRKNRSERVLVTTLTKRMAEDLTEYFSELGIRVRYLHSDINTLERMEIITDLRRGVFDVLIGINLLREGLDIPEVSLVAILDADKEGFLRSPRSLIQTFGRAARHVRGTVIMYADRITAAMRGAMSETDRRRKIQEQYNRKNNITPQSVQKDIPKAFVNEPESSTGELNAGNPRKIDFNSLEDVDELVRSLEAEMLQAAKSLEFEKAAAIRDRIQELKKLIIFEH